MHTVSCLEWLRWSCTSVQVASSQFPTATIAILFRQTLAGVTLACSLPLAAVSDNDTVTSCVKLVAMQASASADITWPEELPGALCRSKLLLCHYCKKVLHCLLSTSGAPARSCHARHSSCAATLLYGRLAATRRAPLRSI